MSDRLLVQPNADTLDDWAARLVPTPELWYADDALARTASGATVITRGSVDAAPFRNIHYANAYHQWRMPTTVSHLIVAEPGWIVGLPPKDRRGVLDAQVRLDRGLVFPRSHVDDLPAPLAPYVVGDRIVIAHAAWSALPRDVQHTALRRESLLWDDPEAYPVPGAAPEHVRCTANAFSPVDGANCFGTTAFCLTADPGHRDAWLKQRTLLDLLANKGFARVDDELPRAGDVLTFAADGAIVHAAWCVAMDRFVNKNGQTRFNPVRIVDRATLDADWTGCEVQVFRRMSI